MIDVHSHLLYGIDDGSKSIDESISIIKYLNEIGIKDIIITPHYINYSSYNSTKENNLMLLSKLKEEIKKNNINTNLYLGNEIYIDENISELIKNNIISSLNDSKYLLIELPMSGEKENYIDIFSDLINEGYIVVLAHPERYTSFQKDFNKIYELNDIGVLFQCNIGSIIGEYGKSPKKVLKRMLKEDLVFMFGTDIHHKKDDNNFLDKAKKKLKKYISEEKLDDLLENNAKKIIK